MLDIRISHLRLLLQIAATGSLSEAALNLAMTVSSASRTLHKLQEEFGDPLFIRTWKGMTPTETTLAMIPVVEELLMQMERLEFERRFDPAKLSMTLSIAAADNAVVSILPPVVRAIRAVAPRVSFRLTPLSSQQFQELVDGKIDFLLYPTANLQKLPAHFFGLNLFRIDRAVLLDRKHPLALAHAAGKKLSAEDLLNFPRVLVRFQDSSRGSVYDVTVPGVQLGTPFIELPYFLGAPYFLIGTQNTLLLPQRTADFFARQMPSLVAIPYPGDCEENFTRLVWHERNDKSLAMQWVRSIFCEHAGRDDNPKAVGEH